MVHLHNGILHHRKEEGSPTLHDSMNELESITLSEIRQSVKDKYNMISLITYSTKLTNKQNITRDIKIENRVMVIIGEGGEG